MFRKRQRINNILILLLGFIFLIPVKALANLNVHQKILLEAYAGLDSLVELTDFLVYNNQEKLCGELYAPWSDRVVGLCKDMNTNNESSDPFAFEDNLQIDDMCSSTEVANIAEQSQDWKGEFDNVFCSYSQITNIYLYYFAKYIAAPAFALLLLFYVGDYVRKIYQGYDTSGKYWVERLLVLTLASSLTFPVSFFTDTQDNRPYGIWLSMQGLRAGFEIGGLVTDKINEINRFFSSDSSNTFTRDLISSIYALQDKRKNEGKDDKFRTFLELPLISLGFYTNSLDKVLSQGAKIQSEYEQNPEFRNALQKMHEVQVKEGSGIGMILGVGLGIISGATSYVSGGGLIGAVKSALIAGGPLLLLSLPEPVQRMVLDYLSEAMRSVANLIFAAGMVVGFYAGVLLLLYRGLFFTFFVPAVAIMVPMGRWGVEKVKQLGLYLLQFLLSPLVMVGLWFLALIVRMLYMGPISQIIRSVADLAMGQQAFKPIILAVLTVVLPAILSAGIAFSFIKVPSYLSQMLGTQFLRMDSGVHSHSFRMPLFK